MQSGPSTCPYCSASAFPTDQISPRRSTQKTQRQTPQTQATNVAFSANGVDSHGSMTGRDIFEIPPKPGGLENVFCVSILTLSPKFSLYPFPQTPSYLSASQTHTLAPTPKAKGKTSFLSLLSFSLSLSLLLYLKVFIMKGAKSKGKADTKLSVKKGAAKKPVKKGKAAKDPNKPKRPASAFFVFMEDFRKTYKEKHPNNKSVAAVGKAGGDKWKSMSDAEKAPFQAKADKRKVEYEKELQAYNKRLADGPGPDDEESDKSRSEVNDDEDDEEGSGEDDDDDE